MSVHREDGLELLNGLVVGNIGRGDVMDLVELGQGEARSKKLAKEDERETHLEDDFELTSYQ